MNVRRLVIAVAALAALPLAAQQPQPAAPSAPPQKIVATINGEVITQEKLDQLWERLGTQMRTQYEATGGKAGFLENYLRKRLLVQEALKSGFDKRPDVQAEMEAAKESALFDRYVRDVVSAEIVTEDAIRKYYDENKDQFAIPEQVKVRHIVIVPNGAGPNPKTKEQAQGVIRQVAAEVRQSILATNSTNDVAARQTAVIRFADAARRYSEDGAAPQGGDLGWVGRGMLDPTFETAAFGMQPGTISGVVETRFGYHLILVEDKRPAGTKSYEEARSSIREMLMTAHAADVVQNVTRLTNELRSSSRISVYPENIK